MTKRLTKSGDGNKRPDPKKDFLVVGIGASAGGIQALSEFFTNVDKNSGVAYVVILHLSPEHESKLAEVLQVVSGIPVTQVREKVTIEPNHVYVVPPNKSLTVKDGQIIVSAVETVEERRAPIDIFFRTLAESHGARAVGVILSGTGANGSMGLKRIKENGGVVYVQNPREAEFSEMPRNSIATELADEILPVAQIPKRINEYRDHIGLVSIVDEAIHRPEEQQNALRDIFTQLRFRTGHDFSNYKRPTMLRRIERRINVRSLPDLDSYAAYLRENPEEPESLLRDLLISVTNFFRDAKAFEYLESEILPRMLKNRPKESPIRVWVPGCATGEEAYSIAMIAAEKTFGIIDAPQVQIFATEIDEQAIQTARDGLYTLNDAADVSPERLRRFFSKEGESYRIRRELREMVLFANHNVLKDPPFSHLDLVSCRNLLIYLNQQAQERILETFHFALEPGGFLFIGPSESIDGSSDLFATVNKEFHIFQARQATARPYPVPESVPAYHLNHVYTETTNAKQAKAVRERITFSDLHLRLLEEYAPPSLVVNQDYEIVHMSEHAGAFLQVAGGEPSNNLLRLVRPDIRLELRTALFQALQQKTNVEAKGVNVTIGGQTEHVNILVRPVLEDTDTARGFVLIVFEPSTDGARPKAEAVYTAPEPITRQLEEELIRSKNQLQSALEQSEIQSEELRASNEELQAMNEELRSSAEELETSKEELQSINEELTTVNQELKVKIDELSHTNNNFNNLLNSIDIGVVFLDRSLRVNLFSPAAKEIFNLIPNDVGRRLTDITSKITYHDLEADADRVLETLQTVEREVATANGRNFIMRMLPYRTIDDRLNGVVITFVDVTERKHAEEVIQRSEQRLQRMVNVPRVGVLTFDHAGTFLHVNDAFLEMVGYTREEIEAKTLTWRDFTPSEHVENSERILEQLRNTGRGGPYEKEYFRRDGSRVWLMFVAADLGDGTTVEYAVDVSDRRRIEAELRASEERLRVAVEASEIATWEWNLKTDRIRWDDRHYTLFGLEPRDDERTPNDFFRYVHPDDRALVKERIEAAIAERNPYEAEFRIIREDRQTCWMMGYGRVVAEDDGMPSRMTGVMFDITERKKAELALRASEERMRRLMESFTDVALFTTDTNSIITAWNPGAEKIFGFTAEEVVGKQSADIIFTPEDRANGEAEKEREIARKEGRAPDERWHMRKDSSRFFASGVMVPLTDGRDLVGYGKVARDLTERKQFEEQLKQAHDELEIRVVERTAELDKSNRNLRQQIADRRRVEEERVKLLRKIVTTQEDERRRIARDLHDQMGQRLTALRLQIASLKEKCADDQALCEQIERLQELGARVDSEASFLAWELRPTVLDDLGLVTAIENFTREWSEHFGINAEFHSSGLKRKRLSSEIETNLYRITQEALNNVYKHSRATAANVLLEMRRKEVVLIVEDNGVGFDVEKQRLDRRHGSSMGLLGIQERAAIVGGTVEIESGPDKGTTVFARIPAVFEDEKRQADEERQTD